MAEQRSIKNYPYSAIAGASLVAAGGVKAQDAVASRIRKAMWRRARRIGIPPKTIADSMLRAGGKGNLKRTAAQALMYGAGGAILGSSAAHSASKLKNRAQDAIRLKRGVREGLIEAIMEAVQTAR